MIAWQVGDLALCVVGGDDVVGMLTGDTQVAPLQGRIFTIDRVRDFYGITGLGAPEWMGFLEASRFRKVTPPEADAFDLSVIEQMTGAPVEVVG